MGDVFLFLEIAAERVGFWEFCFFSKLFFDLLGRLAYGVVSFLEKVMGKSRFYGNKINLFLFCFWAGSRHLVGVDVKEILEISCQYWIFRHSFPFLITRRSYGSNPASATKNESSPLDCFFRF
ncbi:MAG: hypothetical protein J6D19_02165 [Clostridia bacterium]|nr:hypothetical protein [Clostridia bacterium]